MPWVAQAGPVGTAWDQKPDGVLVIAADTVGGRREMQISSLSRSGPRFRRPSGSVPVATSAFDATNRTETEPLQTRLAHSVLGLLGV